MLKRYKGAKKKKKPKKETQTWATTIVEVEKIVRDPLAGNIYQKWVIKGNLKGKRAVLTAFCEFHR